MPNGDAKWRRRCRNDEAGRHTMTLIHFTTRRVGCSGSMRRGPIRNETRGCSALVTRNEYRTILQGGRYCANRSMHHRRVCHAGRREPEMQRQQHTQRRVQRGEAGCQRV